MIISAYQPVDKRSQEGTNSVASQHRSLLLQSSDPTNNPRIAFRRDLLAQLQVYWKDGIEFLLVGDFNEDYGADPDGISCIASTLSLTHLMSYKHPNEVAPVTYARGVKCLYYALGTPQVTAALVAVGYEAFNERYSSDHRGYFLDLDTSILFGSPTQDLATPTRQKLCTTNLKQNTMYIERLYDVLAAHNSFKCAKRLTFAGDRHAFAERLDKDVTAACIAAEANLKGYGEAAWSVELVTARKRTLALGNFFSTMKSGRDISQLVEDTKQVMTNNWLPPETLQQSSKQWREEKKTCRRSRQGQRRKAWTRNERRDSIT